MPRFKTFEDHQRFLEAFTEAELLSQCIERLTPILTHEKKPSTMRVPIDFERDDDAYVLERLREVRRRTNGCQT